jgi:hypothetical protein
MFTLRMTRLICLLAMLVLLHSPLTFGDESASGIVESSSDTSSSTGELLEKGSGVKDRKKSAKKKSTKDWSKIKEEDLDKEWEGGDEDEELEVC